MFVLYEYDIFRAFLMISRQEKPDREYRPAKSELNSGIQQPREEAVVSSQQSQITTGNHNIELPLMKYHKCYRVFKHKSNYISESMQANCTYSMQKCRGNLGGKKELELY